MIMLKLVLFFVLIFGGIFATITISANIKNNYMSCMVIILMKTLMLGIRIKLICLLR